MCRRMRSSAGAFAVALALALVAVPAAALAGTGVTSLGTTTKALTIGAGVQRSCLQQLRAGTRGVAVTPYTARADGAVRFRLAGNASNDWDLAVFDPAGPRLGASQAWGANEIVAATVRKGEKLAIQACRESGSAARLPLAISAVAAPVAAVGSLTPKESLISIPVANQAAFTQLENLDINLNEVPN